MDYGFRYITSRNRPATIEGPTPAFPTPNPPLYYLGISTAPGVEPLWIETLCTRPVRVPRGMYASRTRPMYASRNCGACVLLTSLLMSRLRPNEGAKCLRPVMHVRVPNPSGRKHQPPLCVFYVTSKGYE